MKSCEHGGGRDRPAERRGSDVLGGDRSALPDALVRPSRVELAPCVFAEDVPKMCLGQDEDVNRGTRAGRCPGIVRTLRS
jgi:hypothetical protein